MNHIFLAEFDELMGDSYRVLGQCRQEWRTFLEFAAGYFKIHDITHPLIVEIGIWRNTQKQFYEKLLGAEHIGIDIDKRANPDILGDSLAPSTLNSLRDRLAGRMIDLLFIDGHHSYAGVKGDYETYAPMTRYLVAIHDVLCTTHKEVDVNRFWVELQANDKDHPFILFHKSRSHERGTIFDGQEMGIGLMVKE